jgi:hypothetical protein
MGKLDVMHVLAKAGCLLNPCHVKRIRPGRESFQENFMALQVFTDIEIEQILQELDQ